MLAAPTNPPPKPVVSSSTDSTNSTNTSTATTITNKYHQKTFDAFDSPFYTPNLFGINNSSSTIFFNNNTPTKDDYRLLYNNQHHLQHQQSSSPDSFFSVMADLESSGTRTPSPKNDSFSTPSSYYYCGDSTAATAATTTPSFMFNNNNITPPPPPPPFLYNHQQHPYQIKADIQSTSAMITTTSSPTDHMITDNSFGLFYNNNSPITTDNNNYKQLQQNEIHNYIDRLSTDSLRQQLKDSIETIQRQRRQINLLNAEVEKSKYMVLNYQSMLANKDLELQEQDRRLLLTNQYYETQTKKYNTIQTELSMYKTYITSKGLELPPPSTTASNTLVSGEMAAAVVSECSEINQKFNNSRLCEYPSVAATVAESKLLLEPDLASATPTCFNISRRWSEERSSLGLVSTSSTTTTSNGMDDRKLLLQQQQNHQALDYNRILIDKNVNWDSLVDRIIKDTDQKASLFLQNKFKCATLEQKESIFQSILNQAYELMKNRFGSFLVQKLFELGTKDQIDSLANCMKGHILELTCEPFGCHVVQKVLDHVDEAVKSDLVSELFFKIPDTITHKHACHVWQKVFGIRWSQNNSPPIIKHVHESLKGQWAHVALDETGSLLIQNIFENLSEEDKRPVIEEVLRNAVSIAKGQWGNWVIQHILEQAEKVQDREAAFQIVIDEGIQLSTDQYASKVVEKALRIGGQDFLTKFVRRISSINCSNRPRVALIDIASDQYGNYVIQWLINNSVEEEKLSICRLIKRHMVSLRGSKYGQRVAFAVEKVLRNNEHTTYPTPQQQMIKNIVNY